MTVLSSQQSFSGVGRAPSARIDPQPYFAGMSRAIDALASAGEPLPPSSVTMLRQLASQGSAGVDGAERVLGESTLLRVVLDANGYSQSELGGAEPELVEKGWRSFLVRIANPYELTWVPKMLTNPVPGFRQVTVPGEFSLGMSMNQIPFSTDRLDKSGMIEDAWLQADIGEQPLTGAPIEYRVVHLYSAAGVPRTAYLALTVVDDPIGLHSGTQGIDIDFSVQPSYDVSLDILDEGGNTCVASLVITDQQGRVYPPLLMRVAPDMRFQPQIYRGSGETVRLPAGRYEIDATRGPEYRSSRHRVDVVDGSAPIMVRLDRWIDTGEHGWYPGDPHIHAAGCSHYESPTEGVRPETMIRQVRGEALSVSSVLTWGPGYYHQKQFFTGKAISPEATLEYPSLQKANNQRFTTASTQTDSQSLLRYDLEVSGFPSSHLGHVMLLNLQDQDYPGADLLNDWPSWNLPVLRWAKEQGAIVGYAHCGFGMAVPSSDLPNYEMPSFNGIGTNEAIIDVAHGLVDFLAGAEGLPAMELNAWYHMLNCGYRLAMVGETDYPCIFDERPGVGRTYVNLDAPPVGEQGYQDWIAGFGDGRLYFGDGRTHFLDFTVDGMRSGSVLEVDGPAPVVVRASVAALLEPEISPATERLRSLPGFARPAWHIERARVADSRTVTLEVVVNGDVWSRRDITADGSMQEIEVELELTKSSWVALRVTASGHTYPVFVEIAGAPVRASRRSADWCRVAVDAIWSEKSRFIRDSELADAHAAFDVARREYERIASECEAGS